ncbi:MAG TPA: roadblock/LC7 domain-containing protein [Rubrobacteraceae bacterium]|nr:roadblock/LC7 domain-containing protein [Rubrobacteraceae bacterium]
MAEKSGSARDLEGVLRDLRSLSGDIDSCAVLSEDGELLSSSHGPGVDRERTAAMLAALVALAERVARESGKESVSQVRVKTENGYLLLIGLGRGGCIAATTDPEARVGLALYDMRNARGEVEAALEGGRER